MAVESEAGRGAGSRFATSLTVALVVFVADQGTKHFIRTHLDPRESIPLIDGLLRIVHARNPGAAFSFLADAPAWFRTPFFIFITMAAIGALLYVIARLPAEDRLMRLALGGVLGGALGNLVDRILYGEVTDFIDVYWGTHHWPAFNVADSSITLAVVAVVLHALLGVPADRQASPPAARSA
jgi:signal peptidase II